MKPSVACRRPARPQFSLLALLEYTTLCCVLAALAGFVGIGASFFLMLMALALSARQGAVALAMIWAATVAAALAGDMESNTVGAEVTTVLAALVIAGWYRWRAERRNGGAGRAWSVSG